MLLCLGMGGILQTAVNLSDRLTSLNPMTRSNDSACNSVNSRIEAALLWVLGIQILIHPDLS